MKFNRTLSITHPVKLTGFSAKVSGEVKERFQTLIKQGFHANDIIRVGIEAHETEIFEQQERIKSGSTKRNLRQMQVITERG